MATVTPSKVGKPAIAICNRCIPYLNDDLDSYQCDVVLGALGRKCTRCRTGKHYCVAVEQPLFDLLKKVKVARAAYATAVRDADDQEEIDEREARARALTDELIAGLKSFNINRNKTDGDRVAGRRRRAGASQAGSSDPVVVAELQSIRRGILALVEVGKAFLRDRAVSEGEISVIDQVLGPDAPEKEDEEDEEDEEEDEGMEDEMDE
ncbi:hypothetical protein Q7P35_000810 [Cladosporium inversicolor]